MRLHKSQLNIVNKADYTNGRVFVCPMAENISLSCGYLKKTFCRKITS
jgi:hypothetical protein